jgi:hypothetical protein
MNSNVDTDSALRVDDTLSVSTQSDRNICAAQSASAAFAQRVRDDKGALCIDSNSLAAQKGESDANRKLMQGVARGLLLITDPLHKVQEYSASVTFRDAYASSRYPTATPFAQPSQSG